MSKHRVVLAVAGMISFQVLAIDLYVAPTGADTAAGGKRTPLKSFAGAVERLRALRGTQPFQEPVTVWFADGEYPLDKPVEFLPSDSGTAANPIVYRAQKGANPRFTGGVRLPAFQRGENGVWQVQVDPAFRFEQLYINGERATRARMPNSSMGRGKAPAYFYMQNPAPYGRDPITGKDADLSHRAFYANPSDIAPLVGLSSEELNDAVITVFHSWEVSRARLQSVENDGRVVGTGTSCWKYFYWRNYLPRYQIENCAVALDEPGEWFLDRKGLLRYMPLPGQRLDDCVAIAPQSAGFMLFSGESATSNKVAHLRFENLQFAYSGFMMDDKGWSDGQASISQKAGIWANGIRNIHFLNCAVEHVGNHGIWFKRDCRDSSIRGCLVRDLGGGAVYLGDAQWSEAEREQVSCNMVVDNNILQAGGRIFHGCVGVWIGHASDIQLTHNDIGDFYYTGVSIGWTWGYRPTVTHRNTLAFNQIHHIGWGVLNDMGGIYSLGNQEGTVISNNVIHHVASYDYTGRGGWGLYTDEGSANMIFENNLIHHTKTGNIHQHYGKENVFRNNILVESAQGQIQRSRVEKDHTTIIVTNNIIAWSNESAMIWRGYPGGDPYHADVVFDNNVYWNPYGFATNAFHYGTWQAWVASGHDQHSVCADPLFVDFEKGDYRLKRQSPAIAKGFKPFDPRLAGVYGATAWRKKAQQSYPDVVYAQIPEPYVIRRINEDFERLPVNATLESVTTCIENKGDAIRVVEGIAHSGKRSLCITDAKNLQHAFNPHFFFRPVLSNGVAETAFAVRVNSGADFFVEWRRYATGEQAYKTGTFVHFGNGEIRVRQAGQARKVAALPADTWVKVRMVGQLGKGNRPVWTLTVTVPGQPPVELKDLVYLAEDFTELNWVGFCSIATEGVSFYVDDLYMGEAR